MRCRYNVPFHIFLSGVVVLSQTQIPLWAECCGNSNSDRSPSPEERVACVNHLLEVLTAVEKDLPRDSFDTADVACRIGDEPNDLFFWVRNNTFLVPYRGALRGSRGVLMDRQGNSLDRALLLGDLLRHAKYKVQLIRGSLTSRQASEMIDKVPSHAGTASHIHRSSEVAKAAIRKHISNTDQESNNHSNDSVSSAQQSRRIKQRASQHMADLVRVLGSPARLSGNAASSSIEAAREHWWVRYFDGETWIDLDPTLPDAKPGDRFSKVETILPEQKDKKLEDLLDDSMQHRVTVRVVIEQWRDGKLIEQEVVSHTFVPFQMIDQIIQLQHVPNDRNKSKGLSDHKNQLEALQDIITEQKQWIPVLHIGHSFVKGKPFDLSGAVVKTKPRPTRTPKGFGFGFGRSTKKLSKANSDKRKINGVLTAEWIEYQIHSPARPERVIRRQVFDLIGPAKRTAYQMRDGRNGGKAMKFPKPEVNDRDSLQRNFDLAGVTQILPQVCEISPVFLHHLMIRGILEARQLLLDQAKGSLKTQVASGKSYTLPNLPGGAYALALKRQQHRRQGNLYLDRPNLLAFHQRFTLNSKNVLSLIQSMDIVNNEMAVRPHSIGDQRLDRLEQGVLDTIAEASLFPNAGQVENTAVLYELSRQQKIPWVTVRSDDDLKSLDLPDDIRARIAQDLRNGCIAVAPTRPVLLSGTSRIGWWRIDPKTGDTLGIGSRGWGSSEYPVLLNSYGAPSKGYANLMILTYQVIFFAAITVFATEIMWPLLKDTGNAIMKEMNHIDLRDSDREEDALEREKKKQNGLSDSDQNDVTGPADVKPDDK